MPENQTPVGTVLAKISVESILAKIEKAAARGMVSHLSYLEAEVLVNHYKEERKRNLIREAWLLTRLTRDGGAPNTLRHARDLAREAFSLDTLDQAMQSMQANDHEYFAQTLNRIREVRDDAAADRAHG